MKKFAPLIIGMSLGLGHLGYVTWAILRGTPTQRAVQVLISGALNAILAFALVGLMWFFFRAYKRIDETWARYEQAIVDMQEAQTIAEHAQRQYIKALRAHLRAYPNQVPSLIEVQEVDLPPHTWEARDSKRPPGPANPA